MMPLKEYKIPPRTQVVVVADMFADDYVGGAELTTEALIQKSPYKLFKLHSNSLSEKIVVDNPNVIWVITNWTQAPLEGIAALARGAKYYVIEYDYKMCVHRLPQLHEYVEKKSCDCRDQKRGKFVEAFYYRAQGVFFMSLEQQNYYLTNLTRLKTKKNVFVLSSVWSDEDLKFIETIRIEQKEKKDNWCIYNGGSWVKNSQKAKEYFADKQAKGIIGFEYELIGNLPYKDFLLKMSEYKGLLYFPLGYDTCPRMVVEAKLMGLNTDHLGEYVQHKEEPWFTGSIEECENYLKGRAKYFWDKIDA